VWGVGSQYSTSNQGSATSRSPGQAHTTFLERVIGRALMNQYTAKGHLPSALRSGCGTSDMNQAARSAHQRLQTQLSSAGGMLRVDAATPSHTLQSSQEAHRNSTHQLHLLQRPTLCGPCPPQVRLQNTVQRPNWLSLVLQMLLTELHLLQQRPSSQRRSAQRNAAEAVIILYNAACVYHEWRVERIKGAAVQCSAHWPRPRPRPRRGREQLWLCKSRLIQQLCKRHCKESQLNVALDRESITEPRAWATPLRRGAMDAWMHDRAVNGARPQTTYTKHPRFRPLPQL
jgi:hypothetical protein